MKRTKQYGLALGGGAVLGGVHIGVLKAIEESNIEITHITGTSVGALIGALFAFGKSSDEIATIMLDINWSDIADFAMSKYGLFSNERVGEMIYEQFGEVNLEDAKIPLAVVATDIASGKRVLMKEGNAKEAIMASSCIPGIFTPVEKDDMLLVDGGLVENVPLNALREIGAQRAIIVNLSMQNEYHRPDNFAEILINSLNYFILCRNGINVHEEDMMISPDLSKYNALQTSQIADLIDVGYKEAKKVLG